MNKAAAVPGLNRDDAYRAQLLLPPLAEQRRIAVILDQADILRANRREALAQLDSLVQSIFIEMFGDPKTNTNGWRIATLKSLGKVSTGGTPPSAIDGMFGGDVPFVTPGDLENDAPVRRTLTPAGADFVGTIRPGATLVCCIGATIGKMGKAKQQSAFNQQLNAVDWSDEVDDDYGLAVLRFFKPTIITWGASTTLPILKKSSFEKIEIPVPPLKLQREFSKVIAKIEASCMVQKQQLLELNKFFSSLQAEAFSGKLSS